MTDEAQHFDPTSDLLAAAERVTAPWLRRSIARAATTGGARCDDWDDVEPVIETAADAIVADLRSLLATDVDEQRTNPLSIYRGGVRPATDLLRRHGVTPPAGDPFSDEHFADDPYRLGPAAWSDVDPDLHEPGLAWGAWKAKTVLDRRRSEGRR